MSDKDPIICLLETMSPEEIALLAFLIAVILGKDLTVEKKRVLGDLLYVVAGTLLALAAMEDFLTTPDPGKNMQNDINTLFSEQKELIKKIRSMQKDIQEILLKLENK